MLTRKRSGWAAVLFAALAVVVLAVGTVYASAPTKSQVGEPDVFTSDIAENEDGCEYGGWAQLFFTKKFVQVCYQSDGETADPNNWYITMWTGSLVAGVRGPEWYGKTINPYDYDDNVQTYISEISAAADGDACEGGMDGDSDGLSSSDCKKWGDEQCAALFPDPLPHEAVVTNVAALPGGRMKCSYSACNLPGGHPAHPSEGEEWCWEGGAPDPEEVCGLPDQIVCPGCPPQAGDCL